ncbi:MAG: hypothetical protein IJN53_00515 [Oscillospiraceae bacterium]|nr:hypothetical protein [Oscillospiraceae bacterium]
MKQKIIKVLQFITNPRFLLCFGLGWIITNGWSYILFALGMALDIGWMKAVAGAYLAFLWLPISPEKIATCAIAIALLRWLFPNDQKTLAVLRDILNKAKAAVRSKKEQHQAKKAEKAALEEPRPEETPNAQTPAEETQPAPEIEPEQPM